MKSFIRVASIILIIILYLGYWERNYNKSVPFDLNFDPKWKSSTEAPIGVARTFVKNQNKGCGEFFIRESIYNKGEYLVACTRDGKNWTYYIVYSSIEKALGPVSENIAPPR